MYRAELVVRHEGWRLDRDIAPVTDQPSPRFRLVDGQVFALDQMLAASAARKVGLSPGAQLLNAAPDLSVIVAADQADLIVIAAEEIRLPVPEAQAACLLPGNHILVAAQGNRLLLLDPAAGQALDEVELDLFGYLRAVQHPVTAAAVVTAGQGQDGSRVFAVAESGGRLTINNLADDVLGASFNPSGT
ncbi:MAG TPA: hypothetical protein VFI65_26855, partial [Streptosporangiaceae bacterium]|nr:hypothetical protein [Streptosporangiaceae bacterium]